jgi:tRNA(His) guanylyltransferase
MKEKTLGDRMKRYELEEAGRRMMPNLPIMARLDGRAFHTFTRGLERPYSLPFTRCMVSTAAALVEKYHADLAYTQSDEISLFWLNNDPFKEMPFDGRYQKWTSLLASTASVAFNRACDVSLPSKTHLDPEFDCRVWQLPNLMEVYNCFVWREDDATRNSLQMAAQSHYSQQQLHKTASPQLHDLLHAKGINWNDYPAFFKRGTYIARRKYQRDLTPFELDSIPEDKRPNGPITRSGIFVLDAQPVREYKSLVPFIDGTVPTKHLVEEVLK